MHSFGSVLRLFITSPVLGHNGNRNDIGCLSCQNLRQKNQRIEIYLFQELGNWLVGWLHLGINPYDAFMSRQQKFENSSHLVESPQGPAMDELCEQLREIDTSGIKSQNIPWPTEQLELIADAGVYRWFVPEALGGMEWSAGDIVSGYIRLSSACLTSAFIVTQRVAALKRIASSSHSELRERLLPELLSGERCATVGISHLTTSRQHVSKPVLRATPVAGGFCIEGFSPWVTGASAAAMLLIGAELPSGEQILFVVPTQTEGLEVKPGFRLVGLTASQTGAVKFDGVFVGQQQLIAGPRENVLATLGRGTSTGGFQTSSLALGLSKSAIDFVEEEALQRLELSSTHRALKNQLLEIEGRLKQLAAGIPVCTNEEIRSEANSLVLRATQSALVAAKGTGYVEGHRVGRWCQEALFFLVWSCPQSVLEANLCELAGIES